MTSSIVQVLRYYHQAHSMHTCGAWHVVLMQCFRFCRLPSRTSTERYAYLYSYILVSASTMYWSTIVRADSGQKHTVFVRDRCHDVMMTACNCVFILHTSTMNITMNIENSHIHSHSIYILRYQRSTSVPDSWTWQPSMFPDICWQHRVFSWSLKYLRIRILLLVTHTHTHKPKL